MARPSTTPRDRSLGNKKAPGWALGQTITSPPAGAIMNPPLKRWVPSPAVPASPKRRMPVLSSVYGLPGNACRFTQFALRGADTSTIPKPFVGSSLDMRAPHKTSRVSCTSSWYHKSTCIYRMTPRRPRVIGRKAATFW